jgi:hypothetical protein
MKERVADDVHWGVDEIAALKMDSARKIADRAAHGNYFAVLSFARSTFRSCESERSSSRGAA